MPNKVTIKEYEERHNQPGLKQRINKILKYRAPEYDYTRKLVLSELDKTIAEIKYKIKKLRAVIKVAKAHPRDARDKIDAEVWEAEIEIYNDVLKALDNVPGAHVSSRREEHSKEKSP